MKMCDDSDDSDDSDDRDDSDAVPKCVEYVKGNVQRFSLVN